jgi:putative transcriptional regulator
MICSLTKEKKLIRWRLREIMARHRVSIRKLAELTGMHRNSIGKLRNHDILPEIGGETMEKLCRALNCTPYDLIEYIPEENDHTT